MRILLQRVREAKVEVQGEVVGQIGPGIVLFFGVKYGDRERQVELMIEKVLNLRIFPDEQIEHFFHRNIVDVKGDILVVSQFTLYGATDKGRRPSFVHAAKAEEAKKWYERFLKQLREKSGLKVETGKFQAYQQVHLVNDGPTTLMLEVTRSNEEAFLKRHPSSS